MNKNLKFLAIFSTLLIILNIGFVSAQGGGGAAPFIDDIFATDIGGTEPLPVVNAGSTIVVNVKLGNLGLQPASGILTVYKRFNLNFAKDSEDTVYFIGEGNFQANDRWEGWEDFASGEVNLEAGHWEFPPDENIWNASETTFKTTLTLPDTAPDGSTVDLGAEINATADDNPTDNHGTTTISFSSSGSNTATVLFNTPANNATYTVGNSIPISVTVQLPSGTYMDNTVNPTLSITGQSLISLPHPLGGCSVSGTITSCGYNYSWNTTGVSAGSYAINFTGTLTSDATKAVTSSGVSEKAADEVDSIYLTAISNQTTVSGSVNVTLSAPAGNGGTNNNNGSYTPGSSSWSSFNGNSTNTGRKNFSYANITNVRRRWAFTSTNGPISASPIIATDVYTPDGTKTLVLIGANDGNFYALDADAQLNSNTIWTTAIGSPINSTATYLPGVDIKDTSSTGAINTGNQGFNAVNGLTISAAGEEEANAIYFAGTVGDLPTIQKDVAVFGANDGSVYCLDASNGTELWQQNMLGSNSVLASISPYAVGLGDGTTHTLAYTIDSSGRATAIDVLNGSIWWARTIDYSSASTPAIVKMPWIWKATQGTPNSEGSGSSVGEANYDPTAVLAAGPDTSTTGNGGSAGEVLESFDLDGDGVADTVERWNNVDTAFYADLSGHVTAIDAWTGKILWKASYGPPQPSSVQTSSRAAPIIMDIALTYNHPYLGNITTNKVLIAVSDTSGTIFIIDAHNGHAIATLNTNTTGISGTPVINGTSLYLVADNGTLYKTDISTATTTGLTLATHAMPKTQSRVGSPDLVNSGNHILVSTCYNPSGYGNPDETSEGAIWSYSIITGSWLNAYASLGASENCYGTTWISSPAATNDKIFVGTTGGSPGEVVGLGDAVRLPDLTTSITGVSQTTVSAGTIIDVNCTTTNNNNVSAATSSTKVYLTGKQPIDSNPTGPLPNMGSATSGAANNFALDTTSKPPGTYSLFCAADADNAIAETDETNNITTYGTQITLTAPVNPPTITITNPLAAATLSGVVAITGTAAPNVITSSAIASVDVKIGSGSWVNAVGTTNWSYSWDTTTSPNGAITLNARATDALSNIGSATPLAVTVSNAATGKPDLAISASDISISPSGPYSVGQTLTISATVKNLGLGAIMLGVSPSVQFYQGDPASGGTIIATKTLGTLSAIGNAGSSSTVSTQWTIPAAGSFDIYVIVDPANLIDESVD